MKKNGVVLFLIAIMALSVFGVFNLTTSTKAEAAMPTVTFLSTPAFANAGQPFTISGNVKTSTGVVCQRWAGDTVPLLVNRVVSV